MKGFFNRILSINVSSLNYKVEPIDDELLEKYLGGKGLSTHLLLKYNPPRVDQLSPDNHLILSTGPFSGTPIWGSCRYGIYTKSPQTGFYSESYSGGTVAEYMARTGFDVTMIHGASRDPIWIEISDKDVFFHDAKGLWGLDTFETEDCTKAWIRETRPDDQICPLYRLGYVQGV